MHTHIYMHNNTNYNLIFYQVFAALIESVDQLDDPDSMGESQTGFTQGDPAASAGFSLNHAKFLMEPLRKFAEAIEANLSPEEQTFPAALCDDTTLASWTTSYSRYAILEATKIGQRNL